jgi:hypothetical protein
MTLRRWAALAVFWLGALGIALLFLGGSVAPCLGLPETNGPCIAQWEAQRPWADRLSDTPVPALLILAAVLVATALVLRGARRARRPPDGPPPSDIS